MNNFVVDTISNEDGKTHINIHPRGKTRLGRLLSDESRIPVTSEWCGRFDTEAGFKAWLSNFIREDHDSVKSCNDKWNMLRTMKGSVVKHRSGTLSPSDIESLKDNMIKAVASKIIASDFLTAELLNGQDLVFKSYAVWHVDGQVKVSHDTKDAWKVDAMQDIINKAVDMR